MCYKALGLPVQIPGHQTTQHGKTHPLAPKCYRGNYAAIPSMEINMDRESKVLKREKCMTQNPDNEDGLGRIEKVQVCDFPVRPTNVDMDSVILPGD